MSATSDYPDVREWLRRLLTGQPHQVIGGLDDPYLRRWYVIPRNPWLNVYVHHFLSSDDDRALHDHPWWFVSLMLRADHEERFTVTMEIQSCYERGKVPIVDEKQPSLFPVPNPEADETPGESGIDLSGVDRPGFSDAEGSD